jgi:hypothetical protein
MHLQMVENNWYRARSPSKGRSRGARTSTCANDDHNYQGNGGLGESPHAVCAGGFPAKGMRRSSGGGL